MNGYAFKGSKSVTLIFASLCNKSQLLKERICSWRSKFLLVRVDPILEELQCPGKQTKNNMNCSPL